jgi:predicted nicotinamide N-methyase
MQLSVPDIQGNHLGRTALEQAIGEPTGRGTDIEAPASSRPDAERIEGSGQLLACPRDELRRPLHHELDIVGDLLARLVESRDETCEHQRLRFRAALDQAALNQQDVEPHLHGRDGRRRVRLRTGLRENGRVETIVETLALPGLVLELERPCDPDMLLSEEAFGDDEFLPYWAELWPSGLALAEHVANRDVRGLRVLELGCGLGLPSLAASARGALVLATDWAADAVALLRANAARNNLALEATQTDWRTGSLDLAAFDLVLAADVVYEERNVAPLVTLLGLVIGGGGEAWIADPGRRHATPFLVALSERHSLEAIPHPALPGGSLYVVRPVATAPGLSSSE